MKTQTPSLDFPHYPVMLSEIIEFSTPSKGGLYIDCTFGGGGYSEALLKFPNTKVIGLDRDGTVGSLARKLKKKFKNRFEFHQIKFSQVDTILKNYVDVIIFDLGLSSIQLNNFKRGFSFKSKDDLDMKMGLTDISAKEVINNMSEDQLRSIIKILGEEKEAFVIAKNIVIARKKKEITKVHELVDIIKKSKKKKFSYKINPCTKTFQAIRIFVNKEITELVNGIINATKILKPGGKLLIVTFHSIEDKIIKYFFSNFSKNKSNPSRYLPYDITSYNYLFEKYKNTIIKPSKIELDKNNPSRSAKLRFATRSKIKFFYPDDLLKKFKKYLELEAMSDKN